MAFYPLCGVVSRVWFLHLTLSQRKFNIKKKKILTSKKFIKWNNKIYYQAEGLITIIYHIISSVNGLPDKNRYLKIRCWAFCSQFRSIRHLCSTDQETYQANYFNSLSLSLLQTLLKSRGFCTDTKQSIRINSLSTIVQGHEVLCQLTLKEAQGVTYN